MDFYEWNIADNDAKGRVAKKWSRLNNIHNVNETHVCKFLSHPFDFTSVEKKL